MSINVPEKLSKQEYNGLLNDLKKFDLTKYTDLIKENYKKPKGETEYSLKDGIAEPIRINLDYVLKRISDKQVFDNLQEIARYLRMLLEDKKYVLLFAYNGTGKTRLSAEFKTLGQTLNEETGEKTADTLYYNAFTEDLFYWDNDLENDTERFLKLNRHSRFFSGLRDLEMESRIRPFLHRYADFDFTIDYDEYKISFYRNVVIDGVSQRIDNIKVSRGADIKVIVSTHHALFYNVLCNEIAKAERLFFQKLSGTGYILKDTSKTPFFHHVALLKELKKAADSGELYTYHFNILRNILEKTASFHGYKDFSSCLRKEDEDSVVYRRIINLLSHGNYSIFDPKEMVEENKEHFKRILNDFLEDYKFNQNIFDTEQVQEDN